MNYALSTEHGLLMSGPMALAAYRGIKTQTRFPIKPQPGYEATWDAAIQRALVIRRKDSEFEPIACPYGKVGDRIYIRETFALSQADPDSSFPPDPKNQEDWDGVVFKAGYDATKCGGWQDGLGNKIKPPWRPSIHMPKWAARTWGTITEIRVQRISDISPGDIIAEGSVERSYYDSNLGKCPVSAFDGRVYPDLTSLWRAGWDSIYTGELSTRANPFVWAITWEKETLS